MLGIDFISNCVLVLLLQRFFVSSELFGYFVEVGSLVLKGLVIQVRFWFNALRVRTYNNLSFAQNKRNVLAKLVNCYSSFMSSELKQIVKGHYCAVDNVLWIDKQLRYSEFDLCLIDYFWLEVWQVHTLQSFEKQESHVDLLKYKLRIFVSCLSSHSFHFNVVLHVTTFKVFKVICRVLLGSCKRSSNNKLFNLERSKHFGVHEFN